jgi:hypothetical protein
MGMWRVFSVPRISSGQLKSVHAQHLHIQNGQQIHGSRAKPASPLTPEKSSGLPGG